MIRDGCRIAHGPRAPQAPAEPQRHHPVPACASRRRAAVLPPGAPAVRVGLQRCLQV